MMSKEKMCSRLSRLKGNIICRLGGYKMTITLGKEIDPNDPRLQKYRDAGYEIVHSKKSSESCDRTYKLLVQASKGENNDNKFKR